MDLVLMKKAERVIYSVALLSIQSPSFYFISGFVIILMHITCQIEHEHGKSTNNASIYIVNFQSTRYTTDEESANWVDVIDRLLRIWMDSF